MINGESASKESFFSFCVDGEFDIGTGRSFRYFLQLNYYLSAYPFNSCAREHVAPLFHSFAYTATIHRAVYPV